MPDAEHTYNQFLGVVFGLAGFGIPWLTWKFARKSGWFYRIFWIFAGLCFWAGWENSATYMIVTGENLPKHLYGSYWFLPLTKTPPN